MTWNIWNIKSKALRAIVAWLFAGSAAVVVLLALPVALVWLAVAGVVAGIQDGWRSFVGEREWLLLWRSFGAAARGKEAV